jgi:sarcosine oxidase gamma subunit
MSCDIEYDSASDVNEFKSIACSGEAMAADSAEMMVSSAIVALADGNKQVTFMADGAEKMGEVSGSRTALTINGVEAKRDALAVGMTCDFTYEDGAEIEFKVAACATEAAAGLMTVTSPIVALADRNKELTFTAEGAEVMGEVSGSRTEVTVDGAAAERDALAVGMTCELTYEAGAEIEFKAVACTSN